MGPLNIDNMVVCHCINKGSSKNPELLEFICCMYYILFEHSMECKDIYLPSEANVQADDIYRFNFQHLRDSHPYANKNQSLSADIRYFVNLIQKR